MAIHTTTHPLEQFELLPPAFRQERRVRRIVYGWIVVIGSLSAIFGGLIATTTLRLHRDRQARENLVVAALPLLDLRRDVFRLQQRNTQRQQWCQWVESAKPDDNAFQTLATVVSTPPSEIEKIKIDRLSIRLPLEYPANAKEVPNWATPQLAVLARAGSSEIARQWVEQLNHSDRIAAASLDVKPADLTDEQIELTAIPLTTRILP